MVLPQETAADAATANPQGSKAPRAQFGANLMRGQPRQLQHQEQAAPEPQPRQEQPVPDRLAARMGPQLTGMQDLDSKRRAGRSNLAVAAAAAAGVAGGSITTVKMPLAAEAAHMAPPVTGGQRLTAEMQQTETPQWLRTWLAVHYPEFVDVGRGAAV